MDFLGSLLPLLGTRQRKKHRRDVHSSRYAAYILTQIRPQEQPQFTFGKPSNMLLAEGRVRVNVEEIDCGQIEEVLSRFGWGESNRRRRLYFEEIITESYRFGVPRHREVVFPVFEVTLPVTGKL